MGILEAHQYEIVVSVKGGGGEKAPIAGDSPAKAVDGKSKYETADLRKGIAVYRAASSFAKQLIGYRVNTVDLRTGAKELQEKISFGYDVAQSIESVGSSVLIGAYFGGGVGAAVGALLSISHKAIGLAQKYNTIRLQGENEALSIALMNERAGGAVPTYTRSR